MKTTYSTRPTTAHVLLGASVALWQLTTARGATPTDDAQAQARALLSPPIVHSTPVPERGRLAGENLDFASTDDALRQAQRLLLGTSKRAGAPQALSAGSTRVPHAPSESSDSRIGDAQEAARRMILGRDERVERTATQRRHHQSSC